ncbi:protein mono-ADP-ribosyltransferase PARP10 isoform X2 [Petromyzon marinus]|uniref:protein mono-ADP-ribosyltransferase PARP10 isoform X2 n=1 Tax=Petromyzon marinus TaxID=7757 RepID=UPI003F6E771B
MDEDESMGPVAEEVDGGEDAVGRSVAVTGLAGAALSPELLAMYFENKKRSGGGPVADVSVTPNREARVTFKSVEDMRAVLRQPEHNLCGVPLRVTQCLPLDSTKVLLVGLKPTTQVEVLQLYVEALSGASTEDFALHYGASRTSVLVHFHKGPPPLELKLFVRRCEERCLEGARLRAEWVPVTTRLWVGNLDRTVCQDLVMLYFESRQSGGGAVQDVALSPFGGHAVVTFYSDKVVDQVLRRTHTLRDRRLEVKPYFLQLEEGPSDESMEDTTPSPTATLGSAPLRVDDTAVGMHERSTGGAAHCERDTRNGSAGPGDDDTASAEIAETVVLKASHAYLLPLLQQVIGSMANVFERLKIKVSQNEMQIAGRNRSDVMEAKCRLLTLLSEVIETPWAVDSKLLAFLKKSNVSKYIGNVCNESKINAIYRVTDSSVLIGSFGEESGNSLKEAISNRVHSFQLPLPSDQAAVMSTQEWSEFVQELEVAGPVHFESGDEQMEVTALRELQACVQAKVATFLREHAVVESVFPMEEAVLDFLQEHYTSILQQISEQITLIPVMEPPVIGLKMYGTEVCCGNVREILQGLVSPSSVLCTTVSVPRPGITRLLCHHIGQELLSQTEQQFLCKIRPKDTSWSNLRLLESCCTPARQASAGARGEEVAPCFVRAESCNAWRAAPAGTLPARTSLPAGGAQRGTAEITSTIGSNDSVEISVETERGSVQPNSSIGGEVCGEQADTPEALGEEGNLALMDAGGQNDQENTSAGIDASTEERDFERAKELSLKHFQSNVTLNEEEQLQMAIQNSLAQEQNIQSEEELLEEVLQLSTQNLDRENENVYQLALSLSVSDTANPMACEFEKAIEMSTKADTDQLSLQPQSFPDNIELIICADASGSIDRIKDHLVRNIDGYFHEIKLENECFKQLTLATRGALEREHGVRLTVEGSRLSLYGCKVFTAEALCVLNELLGRAVQEQLDATERDLIGRSVEWLWAAEPGVAVPYPPDANVYLERAWQKKKPRVRVHFNGHLHTVDFHKMEETREGSVRSVKIIRRDLGQEHGSLASAECVALVDLDANGEEFKTIKDQFLGSLENVNVEIIQIQRVDNSVLYRQFLLKKQQIERECSQSPCERILFHGTADAACPEINLHGFNRSFCGKNALYGQGVYFATSARISVRDQYSPPNTAGLKHVYLARVLTGDFAQGRENMRTPPIRLTVTDGGPAVRFHSVVDNTVHPDIFIIFNDTQAYPEHLITFRWTAPL